MIYKSYVARIKAAAEQIEVGLGDRLGQMTAASVRSAVNQLTGKRIPNGPREETLRLLAEALEAKAKDG